MYSKKLIKEYVLDLVYSKEQILRLAECSEENPNYNTYLNIIEELKKEHGDKIIPKAYVVIEEKNEYMKEGSFGVISCLITLGSDIDKLVEEFFDSSDYLEALFLGCIGDSVLFESSNLLYKKLKYDILNESLYMSARQAPGDMKNDTKLQRVIFDRIKPNFNFDISITEGCMLKPKRSLLYFYNLLDEDINAGIDHSCEQCGNLTCINRMKHNANEQKVECDYMRV